MIKAVLFDMDGTLVDTERLGIRAWLQSAEMMGYELTLPTIKGFIGRNLAGVYAKLDEVMPSHEVSVEIYALHKRIANEIGATGLTLKAGARESLDELARAGYRLELVTSSRRETAAKTLGRFGIENAFELWTCGDEVEHGKPAPDIYLLAAQKLGVDPVECTVVEDSANGARSGIDAGMNVFVVPDMVELPQDVLDKCSAVLDSLHELPAALDGLQDKAQAE